MSFEDRSNKSAHRNPEGPESRSSVLSTIVNKLYASQAPALSRLLKEALERRAQSMPATQDLNVESFRFGNDEIFYKKFIPQDPKSDVWLVFVGGFNSMSQDYKNEIDNLVESGRKVVFINPETPHTKENQSSETKELSSLAPVLQTEVTALARMLEHEGIAHADFIGHSRGGLLAAGFAAAYPGHVDRLVLDSPAGIAGKESAVGIISRGFQEQLYAKMNLVQENAKVSDPLKKLKQTKVQKDRSDGFFDQLLQNTTWKLEDEIPAVGESDLRPLLMRIKKQPDTETEIVLVNAHSGRYPFLQTLSLTLF